MKAKAKTPKQAVHCDFCGCAFVPEPKTQREDEIEYTFFNCDYCGKAYLVSVTDAALRKNIRRYAALAERQKKNSLSEKALREIADLKATNLKRAAELQQMYIRER